MWSIPDRSSLPLYREQLILKKEQISGNAYDSKLLGRLAKYIQPYKTVFWISVLLTVLLAAVAPALPLLVEYTLDNYILQGKNEGLTNMLILMFALLIGQTSFATSTR